MRTKQLDNEGDRFHREVYDAKRNSRLMGCDCRDAELEGGSCRQHSSTKQRKECVRVFCTPWWYM